MASAGWGIPTAVHMEGGQVGLRHEAIVEQFLFVSHLDSFTVVKANQPNNKKRSLRYFIPVYFLVPVSCEGSTYHMQSK